MNEDEALANLYPTTETEWVGFNEALDNKERGLFLVDDAHFFELDPYAVMLPDSGEKIDWRIVLSWGFPKVTLALSNYLRQRAIIKQLIAMPKPPHIIVRDLVTKEDLPPYAWIAANMIRACDGNQDRLLEQAFDFDLRATDLYEIGLLAKDFTPRIQQALDLTSDEMLDKYEAWIYKRKQRDGDRVMRKALSDAQAKLADNDALGAQAVMWAGYQQFNKLVRESDRRPLMTCADYWDTFAANIATWRNRDLIGFKTSMQQLTESLLGLRGLVVLGAVAGVGKTLLSLQCIVDALNNHPDACCVFLSLEMHRDELMIRMGCGATADTWKGFVQGGTDDKLAMAKERLDSILPRLLILTRDEFDGGATEILRAVDELRERSGCKRVLVVLDYIQVFEVPLEMVQVFHTDTATDRWRMEELKRLKLTLRRDDCIIAISEMAKAAAARKKTTEDLMGSARIGYGADTVLIWQDLSNENKWEWFSDGGTTLAVRNEKRSSKDAQKNELIEHAEKIDEWWQSQNMRCGWLDITKSRDGTIRRMIPITAWYDKLLVTEGFMNGMSSTALDAKGANENGLDEIFSVDEGALQGDSEAGAPGYSEES